MNLKTFYFNTGVRPYNFTPPVHVTPGNIVRAGIMLIPFDCDNVPEGAVFQFACDDTPENSDHLLKREIFNSNLVSKYAFFQKPLDKSA